MTTPLPDNDVSHYAVNDPPVDYSAEDEADAQDTLIGDVCVGLLMLGMVIVVAAVLTMVAA